MRPDKPSASLKHARQLRRTLTKPEVLLWQRLRGSPDGLRFRKQHPAGPYILDFFCARANLAIEVDGMAHDMGGRPARDLNRDCWLMRYQIDTLRISARAVLADPDAATEAIVAMAKDRIARFGKAPLPLNGHDVDGGR